MEKLIIAASLCAALSAQAVEINIDAGVTQFTQVSNGNWYQDGFPHQLNLTSPAASIGVYTDRATWQFGAGYSFIGHASSTALAVDLDANYNTNTPNHCNGPCLPISHWNGEGKVEGWFIGARWNHGNFFIEPQIYATRPSWQETVPDWYDCGVTVAVLPCVGPQPGHASHTIKTLFNPGMAFGYRLPSGFSLILKVVPTDTQSGNPADGGVHVPGIYKEWSPTLDIGYSF